MKCPECNGYGGDGGQAPNGQWEWPCEECHGTGRRVVIRGAPIDWACIEFRFKSTGIVRREPNTDADTYAMPEVYRAFQGKGPNARHMRNYAELALWFEGIAIAARRISRR